MIKTKGIFDTIELSEMNQVALMNRTDTKYWFHLSALPRLLQVIQNDYLILEINGMQQFPYTTTYYDTKDNSMYTAHHNGKLNRFKVRKRCYLASGLCFLEIKFKNNKGRTIKRRIVSDSPVSSLSKMEMAFVTKHTPFKGEALSPTLVNEFTRLTLVNKNFKERCTIDFNLQFQINQQSKKLSNVAIVEIKSDGKKTNSSLAKALQANRISTSGFSKYCIGRVFTDDTIKQNRFKAKKRKIEQLSKMMPLNV